MSELTNKKDYLKEMTNQGSTDSALHFALDTRKFEINLYWRRTAYFWTLIAAAFAGYFTLQSQDGLGSPHISFVVTCIGFILSLSWYLVNRGSKYWQENWERHVDVLENCQLGPLYKTTISKEEFCWYNLFGGYPYSVSRINQIVSLFIVIIWFGLFIYTGIVIGTEIKKEFLNKVGFWMLITITILLSIFLVLAIGGSGTEDRNINFKKSSLK